MGLDLEAGKPREMQKEDFFYIVKIDSNSKTSLESVQAFLFK